MSHMGFKIYSLGFRVSYILTGMLYLISFMRYNMSTRYIWLCE